MCHSSIKPCFHFQFQSELRPSPYNTGLTHSALARLASLLFHEHAKPPPTLGSLYCMVPLPGIPFPQISAQLHLLYLTKTAHMSPCQQGLHWLPYLNLHALTCKPGNSDPHYSPCSFSFSYSTYHLYPTLQLICYASCVLSVSLRTGIFECIPRLQKSTWNTTGTQKVYV